MTEHVSDSKEDHKEEVVSLIAAEYAGAFLDDLKQRGLLEPSTGTIEAVKDAMAGMAVALVNYGGDVSNREGFAGVVDPEGIQKRDEAMRMAQLDTLTGVLNRKGLEEYLNAIEAIPPQAVVFVDLTNFKAVNDKIDHDRGDKVLQDVAGILSIGLREGDAVARIGGDEFIIVLCASRPESDDTEEQTEYTSEEIIDVVSKRITSATEEYLSKPENEDVAKQGFNIAIGAIDWAKDDTIKTVLKKAEEKMKAHKQEQHETLGSHR